MPLIHRPDLNDATVRGEDHGASISLIIDESDAADVEGLRAMGICATITGTVMYDAAERERLACVALSAARLG